MVEKSEIVFRVVVFSVVYIVVAVVVLTYVASAYNIELKWLLLPVILLIIVWGGYVYRMNVRVLGMPVKSLGLEGLEGKTLTDIYETGKIKVKGEIWNARSTHPIEKGKKVRITKREGMVVEVEPVED